jgi:hypothetical protein
MLSDHLRDLQFAKAVLETGSSVFSRPRCCSKLCGTAYSSLIHWCAVSEVLSPHICDDDSLLKKSCIGRSLCIEIYRVTVKKLPLPIPPGPTLGIEVSVLEEVDHQSVKSRKMIDTTDIRFCVLIWIATPYYIPTCVGPQRKV